MQIRSVCVSHRDLVKLSLPCITYFAISALACISIDTESPSVVTELLELNFKQLLTAKWRIQELQLAAVIMKPNEITKSVTFLSWWRNSTSQSQSQKSSSASCHPLDEQIKQEKVALLRVTLPWHFNHLFSCHGEEDVAIWS